MHKGQSWCRAAGPLSSHCSHTLFPSLIVSPASRSCRTAELRKMKARLQFKNCTLQTLFTAYEKESLGCLEVPLLTFNVSSCSGVLMCSSFLAYLLFHASSSHNSGIFFIPAWHHNSLLSKQHCIGRSFNCLGICTPGMHAPPRPRGKWLPRPTLTPNIFKTAPPYPERAPSITATLPGPKILLPSLPHPTPKIFFFCPAPP